MSRPRYLVIWGIRPYCQNVSAYWTEYHAEQYMTALRLNGTPCRLAVLP